MDERTHALELIRRYGHNASSFQTLEPHFRYWFDPAGDAMVAYYKVGRVWVAAGEPIGPSERIGAIIDAFVEAAGSRNRRVCFFGIGDDQADAFVQRGDVVKVGEQAWWNPQRWEQTGGGRRSIRSQVRRAHRSGVSVRSVDPAEVADRSSPARRAALAVMRSWLSGRRMANMGFVVHVEPFAFPHERRYFVATQGTAAPMPVGFLAVAPIYARRGWLIEDLLRHGDAPNGTTELLVDHAMRSFAEDGCTYATLGMAPLRNVMPTRHAPSRWIQRLFDASVRYFHPLYNFEGQVAFKTKFAPDGWSNINVAGIPRLTPSIMIAVLLAFTDGRPLRFVVVSIARLVRSNLSSIEPLMWSRLAAYFAITLLVWIIVLALAPAIPWFGVEWLRHAWIAFDLIMVGVFLLLSFGAATRQWFVSDVAATALGAAATDWLLTVVHAIAFHLDSARHPVASFVTLIAVLGPTLAVLFFWALYLAAQPWRSTAEERGEV